MIAKRIASAKATSNVSRLVRYVVAAQGREDPRSWKRTADYILDAGGEGEKVGGVRITNCVSEDPAMATLEIIHTQAQNKRSKGDKSYHLVFSFPEGEQPTLEVLHAIEDELCNSIGLGNHQRISAVHLDTANLHVHVAINKVHPETFHNIEPYYDKKRLMETCERLEVAHGLVRTNHGLTQAASQSIAKTQENKNYVESEPVRRSLLARGISALRESYAAAIAPRKVARTLNSLPKLSGLGLVRNAGGHQSLLPGDARNHVEQGRAGSVDTLRREGGRRSGSDGADGKATEGLTPALSTAAADMEAHAGIESMGGWVQRDVAPQLLKAQSWEEVHATLGEYGLAISPRGAGLVIGDGATHVRASKVDRQLSMKALTDRFGAYVAPSFGRPATKYPARPRHPHVDSSVLYRDFQREQSRRQQARKATTGDLAAYRAKRGAEIKAFHAAKRSVLKGMRGAKLSKKLAYAALSIEMKRDFAHLSKEIAERKRVAAQAGASMTWQAWLTQQAQEGNEQALAVLRSKASRQAQAEQDVLTAPDASAARNLIFRHLKPVARKDGSMRYQTADGGVVLDRGTNVRTEKTTAGAAFVALSLAGERFRGQALIVEGSDDFKKAVARAAATKGVDVHFADPFMESERIKALAQQEPAEIHHPAVTKWIDARNERRTQIADIDYTRAWTPADSGAVTYAGRRQMADGSEVLLLSKNNETLVKSATPAVAAKASRWKVGQGVHVDQRGRFIQTPRGRSR